MSYDDQPDPLSDCMEAYDKLKAENTRLKAQLGRLKEVIEKYKSECQPHPCPDLVLRSIYRELMFKEALSDTDGEAWIKMREDLAMAEAFEKAGRRMKANGCYGSATYCFDRAKEHRKAALRSKGGDRIT